MTTRVHTLQRVFKSEYLKGFGKVHDMDLFIL